MATNLPAAEGGCTENVPARFWQEVMSAWHRHLGPPTPQGAGPKLSVARQALVTIVWP
jgi:hypothetical protein